VGLANLNPPVAFLHSDIGEFGQGDGPSNGGGYLLGALNNQTSVTIVVPNGYKCLKPGDCKFEFVSTLTLCSKSHP
jgi:hypothetical protein